MAQKFAQARLEHQAAISKAISAQKQNDLTGQGDDNGDEETEDYSLALGKLVKGYSSDSAGTHGNGHLSLGQQIGDFLMSGIAACLVCIEEVKKTEATWSCCNCHGIFHLVCIQRWIREGVFQRISADFNSPAPPPESIAWNCPKCRFEYEPKQAPTAYLCYCGKSRDPEPDPWLLPHSCGQVCGRALKPACVHTCSLLCHPGPCPPCPAFVHTTCFCGKAKPVPHRCVDREWSCTQKCGKSLACKRHNCSVVCHSGPCEKCTQKVPRSCRCGRKSDERICSDEDWSCGQVCGKALPCGRHVCKEVCHSPGQGGACPPCPLTLPRRCPCGKTSISGLTCDVEMTPACFETCEKSLACGEHKCYQRCHVGDCGACRESVVRRCRCGTRQKTIVCYQATAGEVTCDTRCPKMRDCGRHPCKRKCCAPGSCPPCDNQCNRQLACGKHKCQSRCHNGRCYPCTEILKLSCECGNTTLRVPCGTKNVKPPRCTLLCKKPSHCRHEVTPHKCHFGDCPNCRKQCEAPMASGCGHVCESVCHDWLLVQIRDQAKEAQLAQQPKGPWMIKEVEARWERKSLPCPPCQHLVEVTCLGGHEVTKMACSVAKSDSCHRKCGRMLMCTHHKCEKPCHGPKMKCEECAASCEQPRPCTHECSVGCCHQNKCPPCKRVVSKRCHCDQMLLGIECFKLGGDDANLKTSNLLSCGNRCAKNMPCGHRCFAKCHPGKCEQSPTCAEMVTRRCSCRRIRQTEPCRGQFIDGAEPPALPCDDVCRAKADEALIKEKMKQQAREQEAAAKESSSPETANATESEGTVRQRRRKNRNRNSESDDTQVSFVARLTSFISVQKLIISFSVLAVFGAVVFILLNY